MPLEELLSPPVVPRSLNVKPRAREEHRFGILFRCYDWLRSKPIPLALSEGKGECLL